MQRLEVSGAVRPIYGSLDVKRLIIIIMIIIIIIIIIIFCNITVRQQTDSSVEVGELHCISASLR